MRHSVRTVFLSLLITTGLLSLSAPDAHAASCSASVANDPGDEVTVTASLSTSDVNENGEGEPLYLSSNSSAFSAVDSEYFQAHTYTYKTTQANETIIGTIGGFDADESCDVSALVTAKSLKYGFLTQGDRNALESASKNLVIGASALGVVAAACAEGIITAPICSLPTGTAAAISVLEAAILDKVATDPSDPNFTVIAQPSVLTLPPVMAAGNLTQAEADAFNALFNNEAATIAYARVVITSFNRAQGALDAGNAYWQDQQMQAAKTYLGQLLGYLSAEPALRTNLSALLTADSNFASFSLTANQALNGEFILAYNFPSSIYQALVTLGADAATISNAQGLLFVQDINAVAGNVVGKVADPALIQALNGVVETLGITVQIAIKPGDGTTAVINANSRGKIPVAVLSTSAFDATTQIDRTSLTFGAIGTEPSLAFCNSGGADVNGDGLPDLVCHFDTTLTQIQSGATSATLMGRTTNGVPIRGTAPITTVP